MKKISYFCILISVILVLNSCHHDKLKINYGKTVEQYVAEGHYDVGGDIVTSKYFPILENKGEKEVEFKLFQFDFDTITEYSEIIFFIEKSGYHPATLIELLALGSERPELQKKFPVIALGTMWKSPFHDFDPFFPMLDYFNKELWINFIGAPMIKGNNNLCTSYRFLGIRK